MTASDLRREAFREQLSDAAQPVTGMNAQQLAFFKLRTPYRGLRCD